VQTMYIVRDGKIAWSYAIPSKENGFDVEGIAVRGDQVWVGLRGPVLSGHAVVLRFVIREKTPGQLTACKINHGRRYRKYMIDTRGLGIRDMRWQGDDLLLLVGPTMALDGPAFVLSWRDAIKDDASGVIDPGRIKMMAELPYQLHADHPEGLDLWPEAGSNAILIIYDAPAHERTDPDRFMVRADVIGPSTSPRTSI